MKYAHRLRPLSAAFILDKHPHKPHIARKASFRRGQLYEAAAGQYFANLYGDPFLCGMWLSYSTPSQPRNAIQIDALLLNLTRSSIHVIEFKIRHTATAYRQLTNVYCPVLEVMLAAATRPRRAIPGGKAVMGLPPWTLFRVEVCGSYDPEEDLHIPEKPLLIKRLEDADPTRFNVLNWRQSR